MASDDSMIDDVFESAEDAQRAASGGAAMYGYPGYQPPPLQHAPHNRPAAAAPPGQDAVGPDRLDPSPTGYRDYQPPAEVLSQYDRQRQEELELIVHKVSGSREPSLITYREFCIPKDRDPTPSNRVP